MSTHLDDLPDELLLQILDLLPDSDLIDVIPSVCLRWSRLSVDSHIWKNRVYHVDWQSASDVVRFFSRKPALRSVTFKHSVDEAVARCLASNCPTITSLTLNFEQPMALDTLRLITRNCDRIRDLRINSAVLSCPGCAREVALMPHLETLAIHGVEDPQLRELGAGCPRLRHLDLGMTIVSLGELGAPLLRRLQGLSVFCKVVTRDIVHCPESLEKLTLNYCFCTSLSRSTLVKGLLPLKALTHVKATELEASPELMLALMKPRLQSLDLTSCQNLEDDLLLELCHRCPLLQDLNLSKCDLITARGLSSMWNLRRLRRLCLDKCESLGSGTMKHLARCNSLQELHLKKVYMDRRDAGVSQLLELSKLRVLEFDAWSARDLIPWRMFSKAFPHLRTLKLGTWRSRDISLLEILNDVMSTVVVSWKVKVLKTPIDISLSLSEWWDCSCYERWVDSDLEDDY